VAAPSPPPASSASADELVELRARVAELERALVDSTRASVKREEALEIELSALRAEHATRLAALHTVTEEKETIRCELENVKVAKAASDAAASDARAMREDLANEAEAFERSVRAAVAAKEAEWSARDDAMTRKAEENDAKLEEARETTRRLFVVHAAQRRAWASERVELLRRAGDASDAAGGGADASKHVQAAVEVAFRKKASSATKEDAEEEEEEEEEPPATPGTALERLFAATTSASKSAPAEGDGGFNACEGLLRDAMEAEVVEAIVRGYCVDEDDGSVIVGASAIVEHVVRRYEEDPAATSRRRKIAAAAAAAGATVDVPSSAPPPPPPRNPEAEDEARRYYARERAFLLASLQEARAKADAVVARAAAEDAAADAKSDAATSDDVLLTWSEQEEAHAVAALRISAEERVLELTEQLEESRRRSVSPAALKRVSRELRELRRVLYTGPHTTAFAW